MIITRAWRIKALLASATDGMRTLAPLVLLQQSDGSKCNKITSFLSEKQIKY